MSGMKDLFFVIILAMGVFFLIGAGVQILIHRKKPVTKYTCRYCGEHDCICHKE